MHALLAGVGHWADPHGAARPDSPVRAVAGAVESVFAVKALAGLTAPPTINIEDLDDEVALDVVRDRPRALPAATAAGPAVALNNAIDFDGHHVALAFRRV